MISKDKSCIILLGFKNVGKSTVGKKLAEKLRRPFIDLDEEIEQTYQSQAQQHLSCREILIRHGEFFFREVEAQALRKVMNKPTAVIALGGGTPLREENQLLLKPHWLVHITAAPNIVYQRMMAHGKPAFFPMEQNTEDFFQRLWSQRETVYAGLADLTVDNTESVEQTVAVILKSLEKTR